MRRIMTNKFLAATSLALTVAVFGCTTNRYPGNGGTITAPGYGASNHSVMPGSSSGTEGVPPMASSYMGIAQPNTDALAEAAARQGYQGRVLGPVNPGGVQVGVPLQPTGQVVPPAMIVNPQSTVNPSVSSPGEEAVTGGVGGGDGGVLVAGTATVAGASVAAGTTVGAATSVFAPQVMNGVVSASPVNVQQNAKGQIVVSNVSSVPSTKSSMTTSVKP